MSEEEAPPVPEKVDAATLAIRGRPNPAIRFRRGVIVGIAAFASISLFAVAWLALKPKIFYRASDPVELAQPAGNAAAEALGKLSPTYRDVPKLGPPLPGDLGVPIRERQRQLALESGTPASVVVDQAQAAERQQQLAQRKAARESAVLVSRGAQTAALPVQLSDAVAPAAPGESNGGKLALDIANDPNAQGRKAAFVAAIDPRGDINPHALAAPPSPYVLSAGSVIAASLITGLRSDLPGLVTAQVTENVYDSPTGRILLVPQGARLIGSYDSVVAFGQTRALIVWQRIILPDGSALRIDNVPAADAAGYAGLQDKVDLHTWQLLKGVALSTMLGFSSELALSGQSDLVQALRMSTQDSVARAGDQITQRNLGIQPTITIRPGAPVRLVVHKDLILAPWRQPEE